MAAVIALACVLCIGAGWYVGHLIGATTDTNQRLRALGLTRQSATHLARAEQILNQLVTVDDLNSDFDILTPESRQQVETWLTAYRKETTR